MKILRRLNEALPHLVLGILIYGLILQLAGVWFAADKVRYSTGLWIGVGCAVFMGIHIALNLTAVPEEEENEKRSRQAAARSMLRFFVVVTVFVLAMKFHLGDPFTLFAGVMGLKVSAYFQPLLGRLFFRKWDEREEEDR